jgi:hypothetical protein
VVVETVYCGPALRLGDVSPWFRYAVEYENPNSGDLGEATVVTGPQPNTPLPIGVRIAAPDGQVPTNVAALVPLAEASPRGPWTATITDTVAVGSRIRSERAISPDGSRAFAETGAGEVCAFGLAAGVADVCGEWTGRTLASGAQWSSDGRFVAFTEDAMMLGGATEVWVFDLTSGEVNDLTQLEDTETNVALYPAFARHTHDVTYTAFRGGGVSDIERVTVGLPGEAEVITGVRIPPLGTITQLPAGILLYGTIQSGVVAVLPPDPEPILAVPRKPFLELGREREAQPYLAGWSPDRRYALVGYRGIGAISTAHNVSAVDLLDLSTGEVTPLLVTEDEEPRFLGPFGAGFSPDGTAIVMTYRGIQAGEQSPVVAVIPVDEVGSVTVDELPSILQNPDALGPDLSSLNSLRFERVPLTWHADNTVWIGGLGDLLQLTISGS